MGVKSIHHPNGLLSVRERVRLGLVPLAAPLAMLPARLVLFAAFQVLIAAGLAIAGVTNPWFASSAWWPVTATLASIVTILLLASLARREGLRLRDLYNLGLQTRRDIVPLIGVLAASAALATIPTQLLGVIFFGDPARPLSLFVRPLPMLVALAGLVAFPLSIAFAELPTYFGYVMPRLEALCNSRTIAVLAASAFLGLQHVTLPLIFDLRFVAWRALQFFPFALLLGLAIRWRPGLLPYLMAVHALIDVAVAAQVLGVSL